MRSPIFMCLCLLLPLAACGDDAGAADAAPASDCGLGMALLVRTPTGEYEPIAATEAEAELVLGFQGFRYIYVRAHFTAAPDDESASITVTLDGAAARSQPLGALGTSDDGTGGFISAPVRVFFNDDPLPSLVDRGCRLTLRLADGACAASGQTTLSYDPACYEGPDGSRICNDAGPTPGPDGGP